MYEQNNASSFVNDYASFTSVQQTPDGHHSLSHAADMADVGSVVVVACTALAITFALKNTFRSRQFTKERAAFKRLPVAARAAFVSLMVAVIAYGGAKPGTNDLGKVTRPLAVLLNSGEQRESTPEAISLTENQQLAGFALTAVVTNETFDLSSPSSATVHSNWLKRGASEDGFWV